jgi:FtsH-binding integral membrane protein
MNDNNKSIGESRNLIGSNASTPRLSSRILMTWVELMIVGIVGGLVGTTIGGAPGFIVSLTTTLLTVGIIFYNVNELIKNWIQAIDEQG